MKEMMFERKLDCGHFRDTAIGFMVKNYKKPKVGDLCYCRQCWRDVKVVEVIECDDEEVQRQKVENKLLFAPQEEAE